MSGVPQAWTDLIAALRRAQVARDIVREKGATQQLRDCAVIDYSRACDAMVEEMSKLSAAHDLGRITLLLSKKDRA